MGVVNSFCFGRNFRVRQPENYSQAHEAQATVN